MGNRPSYLHVSLVTFPIVKMVPEEKGPKLAVLVLDVIFDGSLAGPAKLIGLFQMMFVDLNFFVVFALPRKKERN